MGFVQLGTVAAGAHCRGIQSRPHARGALLTSFLRLCSGIPRSLLGRRRCVSSLPGRSAPSPFLCSVYTRLLPRQDSKWRPSPSGWHQLHVPRGAQQNLLRGPLWPRLFGPSGHEQARKREVTAPGKGAIGAANAAPSSQRRTRSPRPSQPGRGGRLSECF
ncbi:hypothetical protein NDU88_003731 [Pleurodeles waltl]|uniref:Uncharacterized protein n=1 Tax=Pleurodeles waltl TaxID=8319 RepID=A0AAV7UCY5_PLEWA|nr:hypothetical protein NDU88_003731 [Pleurodeles waltl]